MNCPEAQEKILESFDGPLSAEEKNALDLHVSVCSDCARLLQRQSALDLRLCAAMPVPQLSPGFRTALQVRIRRQPQELWPDSLPDFVHLASCGVAIALSAVLLPVHATTILWTGIAVTALTYFIQTLFRNSLEELGERSW